MDKWDEATAKIAKAVQAEEPDAALAAGLGLLAEFGRTLELISEDLDRLATAAEKANEPVIVSGGDAA